jgi:branched-chain amino acid transport system substrate-binding protein
VAANNGPDEVVMREVAARYPRIAFVAVAHGPREVTLHRAAPNLFRFAADHGQGVAGLAEHAYRRLGWRRVAVVAANWDAGWGGRDAFTAEFCALGGAIAANVAVDFFDPKGSEVARIPSDVDGVAVFAPGFFGPAGFLRRLARRASDPARRIVVGPGLIDDPVLLRQTARALGGVAGSSNIDSERLSRYLRAFARAFPGVPASVAASDQVSGYRDAVEAVLQGLEQAGGDPARLRRELARLPVELLGGRLSLDADRQAVVSTRLVRISAAAPARQTPLGTVAGVDQSIGGLLERTAMPSDTPATCRRGRRPPPWAR